MGMSKYTQVSALQQETARFTRESFQLLRGIAASLGGNAAAPRKTPVVLVRRRKAEQQAS